MAKKYAVRNIALCTKDCLCLYVCPTGASDTENSIIDKTKCIGCGACAGACPSHAISMVPCEFPPQQKHEKEVISVMKVLFESKAKTEQMASELDSKLAKAIQKSSRIMAEDIIREAGYMLPQSGNARVFLQELKEWQTADLPIAEIENLLSLIKTNEEVEMQKPQTWKCSICGHEVQGELQADFICPICKQPKEVFKQI